MCDPICWVSAAVGTDLLIHCESHSRQEGMRLRDTIKVAN